MPSYNPDNCVFLLSQSLNANQFNNNVPDANNLVPHNLLWDLVANKLIWVNTLTNEIVKELGGGNSGLPYKSYVANISSSVEGIGVDTKYNDTGIIFGWSQVGLSSIIKRSFRFVGKFYAYNIF